MHLSEQRRVHRTVPAATLWDQELRTSCYHKGEGKGKGTNCWVSFQLEIGTHLKSIQWE